MITYNEEDNIDEALRSVLDAGEIIIVDSFSTDRTVEIARKYTDRLYQSSWQGFAKQKQQAIDLAEAEWVFLLDADERMTPELKKEIEETIKNTDKNGFFVPRKNYFLNRWIRHSGWWPDYTLRLFRNGTGRIPYRAVHERIVVDGETGHLKKPFIHYTYKNTNQFIDKAQKYSSLAAQEMHSQGRRFRITDLLFRPPVTFMKMYFLQQGFRDGLHGLVLAILYSYYTFLKYIKLWEATECTSE